MKVQPVMQLRCRHTLEEERDREIQSDKLWPWGTCLWRALTTTNEASVSNDPQLSP